MKHAADRAVHVGADARRHVTDDATREGIKCASSISTILPKNVRCTNSHTTGMLLTVSATLRLLHDCRMLTTNAHDAHTPLAKATTVANLTLQSVLRCS